MARASRAININDGRLVMRTEATDALHGLYRPIPDDVAEAIVSGGVKAMDVVNAIMKKDRFDPNWSWKKFQEEQKALNMRQTDVELGDDDSGAEAKKVLPDDNPDDMVSLAELGATSKAKKAVKEKEEKVSAAKPSVQQTIQF
jgi:hypothetical protein